MERQVSIYALCDPDSGDVRYIGQTVNVKKRTYEHINKLHVGNKKKQTWIQSLLDQGKVPLLKILYVVDQPVANQAEMDAIAQAKLNGADLLNGSPRAFGGGQIGWAHGRLKKEKPLKDTKQSSIRFTPETKRKILLLAKKLGITQAAIVSLAVHDLAKKYGIEDQKGETVTDGKTG